MKGKLFAKHYNIYLQIKRELRERFYCSFSFLSQIQSKAINSFNTITYPALNVTIVMLAMAKLAKIGQLSI